jgi:hypothetical protein
MILNGLAIAVLAAGSLLAQYHRHVSALTTYFAQVVPLVIIGEGWSQRIVLTNVDASLTAVGTVEFLTQSGQPWTVNLTNGGQNSVFAFSLQPGQTVIFETVVQQNPQILGWALVQETTSGIADLFGQTIFRKQRPGLPDFMSSMVLGGQAFQTLTVFFDNTDGRTTGMGILTSQVCTFSCDTPVPLQVTVQGLSGNIVSQKTINQLPGVLYWMDLSTDFPETNGRTGTFVVQPVTEFSTTLTGFSLQYGNGGFTVITPFEN